MCVNLSSSTRARTHIYARAHTKHTRTHRYYQAILEGKAKQYFGKTHTGTGLKNMLMQLRKGKEGGYGEGGWREGRWSGGDGGSLNRIA